MMAIFDQFYTNVIVWQSRGVHKLYGKLDCHEQEEINNLRFHSAMHMAWHQERDGLFCYEVLDSLKGQIEFYFFWFRLCKVLFMMMKISLSFCQNSPFSWPPGGKKSGGIKEEGKFQKEQCHLDYVRLTHQRIGTGSPLCRVSERSTIAIVPNLSTPSHGLPY